MHKRLSDRRLSEQDINSMSAEDIAIQIAISNGNFDDAYVNVAEYGNINIIKKLEEINKFKESILGINDTLGLALYEAANNGHIDYLELLLVLLITVILML
jgi:ankyrin repeat protein